MSRLRQQMDDAMVLRGFAERTRESYLQCVTALARHFRCSPDRLDAAQIQAYLLYLITEKKLAYASVNQAACAFRFLFGEVLRRPSVRLDIPMAKVPTRLPQVLARAEVMRLFEACTHLRTRTLLMTTYAAGLRVSEIGRFALTLQNDAPLCNEFGEASLKPLTKNCQGEAGDWSWWRRNRSDHRPGSLLIF